MQAEVDFVCRDVFAECREIVTLQRIQEDEEAQNFIIRCSFGRGQMGIVLGILCQIDFFRYPEVIHGLTIPVAYPFVSHVIEIIQIGCIASDHLSETGFCITFGIEEGIFPYRFLVYSFI